MVLDNTPVWIAECSSDGPDYDFHQKIVFGVFTDKKMAKACLLYKTMDIVSLSANEQYPDIPKSELKRHLNITIEKISNQIELVGEATQRIGNTVFQFSLLESVLDGHWEKEA